MGVKGDPELFLLRNLLFKAESTGWLLCLCGCAGSGGSDGRMEELEGGLCAKTVGLNVTVRGVLGREETGSGSAWVGRRGSFSDMLCGGAEATR